MLETRLDRTMRFAVALVLVLTACEREPEAESAQPAGIATPCALAGAAAYDSECRAVRTVADGRTLLTLNAPDGAFRRFEVAADGSGIAAADGALPARTRPDDAGGIEIAIARDRYRLPAAP